MDIRQTRSKTRNNSAPNSPASRRRKPESADLSDQPASLASSRTPPRKKVRFSDPGPELCTGLTPGLQRTSFEESNGEAQTPSRRLQRRRSTPLPRSRRTCDPSFPFNSSERVVQFTPLRQILSPRASRRIRRTGLSDEINSIEREKREASQYEKSLESLLRERDALKQELEVTKRVRGGSEDTTLLDQSLWAPSQVSVQQLEAETSRLREELSFSSNNNDQENPANDEGDTIMINESGFEGDTTLLISNSPDIRSVNDHQLALPDDLSTLSGNSTVDVSTQAYLPDEKHEADLHAISLDLEAARKEKKDLFDACRARAASFEGSAISNSLGQLSPPPDFLDQIVPTLTAALTRATDATRALDSVREELSNLGFHGTNVDEIIGGLRNRFRSARLELERAIPGETSDASLNDGSATLSALVKRVELLVKTLEEERNHHDGTLGREQALKGQFNTLLSRYETATKKIRDLEQNVSSSAGDMLHTRMRMQELESEGKEQAMGIERLNAALGKYREEVKSLETLVTGLEEEKASSQETHRQEVSQLQSKVTDETRARLSAQSKVAAHESRIRDVEEIVEQNRIRASDLTAKVESLEREHQQAVNDAEEKAAQQTLYEHEIGSMNVVISELTTSLEGARSEAERLRFSNTGLEEQLQLEIEARDNLLDKWAADQARSFTYMKETVNAERRKAKVRTANWEMKSDDPQSDNARMGSEPITPVSMTRFVNVEVGRGKNRRRLDSGIGILTEEELGEEDEDRDGSEPLLPSDPAHL